MSEVLNAIFSKELETKFQNDNECEWCNGDDDDAIHNFLWFTFWIGTFYHSFWILSWS
jgi:hypothetical protein